VQQFLRQASSRSLITSNWGQPANALLSGKGQLERVCTVFYVDPEPSANRRHCSNCSSESTSPPLPSPSYPFLPSSPFLFPSPPIPSPYLLPLPYTLPLKPARGSGEHCMYSSPAVSGAEPRPQSHFAALYARKTHLVAAFLVLFRVQNGAPPQSRRPCSAEHLEHA